MPHFVSEVVNNCNFKHLASDFFFQMVLLTASACEGLSMLYFRLDLLSGLESIESF